MGGLNTEERSACDVFDIVFDGNLSDIEDNGIEDEIIQKLVARVGRRVSKKYQKGMCWKGLCFCLKSINKVSQINFQQNKPGSEKC